MSVLSKLAGSLGRRDEQPNVDLAEALVEKRDAASIKELVNALTGGAMAVQNDAIKVLYEIGEAVPVLLARLKDAAPNQFPMYAEQALAVVTPAHSLAFEAILRARLAKIVPPSKRKRVEKVLKAAGAKR